MLDTNTENRPTASQLLAGDYAFFLGRGFFTNNEATSSSLASRPPQVQPSDEAMPLKGQSQLPHPAPVDEEKLDVEIAALQSEFHRVKAELPNLHVEARKTRETMHELAKLSEIFQLQEQKHNEENIPIQQPGVHIPSAGRISDPKRKPLDLVPAGFPPGDPRNLIVSPPPSPPQPSSRASTPTEIDSPSVVVMNDGQRSASSSLILKLDGPPPKAAPPVDWLNTHKNFKENYMRSLVGRDGVPPVQDGDGLDHGPIAKAKSRLRPHPLNKNISLYNKLQSDIRKMKQSEKGRATLLKVKIAAKTNFPDGWPPISSIELP
jgi:hypothetical protein